VGGVANYHDGRMNAMEGLEVEGGKERTPPRSEIKMDAEQAGEEKNADGEAAMDGVENMDKLVEKKEKKGMKITLTPADKKTLAVTLRISSERLGRVVQNPNPKPLRIHRGGWPKGVKRSKTGEAMTPEESAAARAAQEAAAAAAAAAKALKASQASPAVEKKDKTGDTTQASHPKLGPKGNAGAINAQLRALERDGRKCRRWSRRKLELHSFTGMAWELPLWTGEAELPA